MPGDPDLSAVDAISHLLLPANAHSVIANRVTYLFMAVRIRDFVPSLLYNLGCNLAKELHQDKDATTTRLSEQRRVPLGLCPFNVEMLATSIRSTTLLTHNLSPLMTQGQDVAPLKYGSQLW